MRLSIAALVVSLSIFWGSVSQAQDVQDIPAGEDVIAAVKKGEPAPFNGQIFDINTALRWANWLSQYKGKLAAVERRERALCQSELSYQHDLDQLEIDELKTLNIDLKTRLKRSETVKAQAEYDRDHPSWYSSVWFGVALGALGASGLVYLGTQAF